MMKTRARTVITGILCIVIPLLLGFASSMLAGDIRAVYDSLNKPPLSPPGNVFGIVWPILYIAMGIASFLVLRKSFGKQRRNAMVLYVAQLLLNAAWSVVFFRGGNFWAALGVIIVLDILVVACTVTFYKITKPAGFIMVPYLLWIFFATYLNLAFAIVN